MNYSRLQFRLVVSEKKEAKETIESLDLDQNDVQSITKLQANIRGRKARKEKQEQTEAVNKIAAIQRGRKARKQIKMETNTNNENNNLTSKVVEEGKFFFFMPSYIYVPIIILIQTTKSD